MTIVPEVLHLPPVGQLLEVRFALAGSTASWEVRTATQRLQPDFEGGPVVELTGRVVSGHWSAHVDGRIDRQHDTINSINEHVRVHCPELRDKDRAPCWYLTERREGR